jgi:hypothetical protein
VVVDGAGAPSSLGHTPCLYSPECVEGKFSEVHIHGPAYPSALALSIPWSRPRLSPTLHAYPASIQDSASLTVTS